MDSTTTQVQGKKMSEVIAMPSAELMAITRNTGQVIELACRACYLFFQRYNTSETTDNVIGKNYHSVWEYATAAFGFKGFS